MDGFRVFKPRIDFSEYWKARYGLYLMAVNAWADKQTELTGQFVEPEYMTEEEFREHERARRMKKLHARFGEADYWKGKRN